MEFSCLLIPRCCTRELISHELFHGYQDSKYPGMGNGTGPGSTNIEFEQYVFQSM